MNTIWLIVAVMFASGVFGGIVNFFIADPEAETPLAWWKQVVVGVVAAFMVPLFLNMISSELIDGIRGTKGHESDLSKLFVLAGFCLVAAVSSRAFIRTLSERVLRLARSANKRAEAAQVQAAEARAIVAPLVEEETPDQAIDHAKTPEGQPEVSLNAATNLNADERAVLTGMTSKSFTMRSISGLAKDTGLEKVTVNMVISSLMKKGFVAQAQTSKGQPRWYATSAGRTFLAGG